MRYVKSIWLSAVLSWVPLSASAGDFDGTSPLVCSSISAVHCTSDGNCMTGNAASVNLPQFFRIDFAEKAIEAKRPDGETRSTAIDHQESDGGQLILQGGDFGLAWSVAIDEASGQMTISAAASGEAFAVFGACIKP